MDLNETIDRLYGVPLAEFTGARDAAARELREAGDRDGAARVKALRKPSAAAGAVNLLVREHRRDVEEFLRAATVARDAQFSAKGDLAKASQAQHDALERLVRTGGEKVRQTLLAAAVDDEAAAQLLEARLVQELEPAGFGTLLAHATPSGERLKPPPKSVPAKPSSAPAGKPREGTAPEKPKRRESERTKAARTKAAPNDADGSAAKARLAEAEAELEAAEAEERQARRHWDDTRREVDKARRAVEQALRDLDRPEGD